MERKNPHEKNISAKCELCSKSMNIDEYNFGACPHCGWNRTYIADPNKIQYSYNFVSFNRAKQLLKEGKPLKPNFEEFIECIHVYNEMEFQYNNKIYLAWIKQGYKFGEDGNPAFHQTYATREEFMANANINGILLKDIWDKVTEVHVM